VIGNIHPVMFAIGESGNICNVEILLGVKKIASVDQQKEGEKDF